MATETEYQAKTRLVAVPAVYLIMRNPKDEILLMLRDGTGYQDGNYDVPSGHLEGEEGPLDAVIRETKEEVGVDVEMVDLSLVHTSYRPKHDKTGNRIDLFFYTEKWKGEPQIMEPNKCKELIWVPEINKEMPNNMVPHVREAIFGWIRQNPFSQWSLHKLKLMGLYKL